jgi:hypothetical protein
MDLSTFIVAAFCLKDDRIADLGRLRGRGPAPTLCDSEVLTIEVVGEFLGLDEECGARCLLPAGTTPTSSPMSCG